MKTWSFWLLTGLLVLVLAACTPAQGRGQGDFASLTDPESGTVIALGMTRTQAEELLGEGTYQKPITYLPGQMEFTPTKGMTGFGQTGGGQLSFVVTDRGTETYSYGQGEGRLVLTYREGKVTDLCPHSLYGTQNTQAFRWKTSEDITYGSTLAQVEACYPQGTLWESSLTMEDKPLSLYVVQEEEAALCFSLTEVDGVVSVSVSQDGEDWMEYMEQDG